MPEELLMMRQRRFCLPVFVGLLEDLKTRDDASLHFIQGHQSSKFDVCSAFVAGDDAGLRVQKTHNLLLLRGPLALPAAGARLRGHPSYPRGGVRHLLTHSLRHVLTSSAP